MFTVWVSGDTASTVGVGPGVAVGRTGIGVTVAGAALATVGAMVAGSVGVWVGLTSVGVATDVTTATTDTAASLPQPETKSSARNKAMMKGWGQGTEIRRFTYHTIIDSIPT